MSPKPPFDYSHLTPAERVELAHELWESAESSEDGWILTEAQRAELDRRLEEYERDPDAGVDWEDLREELLQRVARRRASAA